VRESLFLPGRVSWLRVTLLSRSQALGGKKEDACEGGCGGPMLGTAYGFDRHVMRVRLPMNTRRSIC
jgi:hypothetical protein